MTFWELFELAVKETNDAYYEDGLFTEEMKYQVLPSKDILIIFANFDEQVSSPMDGVTCFIIPNDQKFSFEQYYQVKYNDDGGDFEYQSISNWMVNKSVIESFPAIIKL